MVKTYLDNIRKYIPHYWPMTTFVHHNPLHGFEDMPFKEALNKLQDFIRQKFIWTQITMWSSTKKCYKKRYLEKKPS
jgi:hypothetical protein